MWRMNCFVENITFYFVILIIGSLLLSKAIADDFTIDPKIENSGPVIKLATSDLSKVPLIIMRGESINWEEPGIRIEQMRYVAEMIGVRFAYARLPWRRALKLTEAGESDAAFVAGYSEERAKWGVYPYLNGQINSNQAISKVSYYLYTLRGSAVTWDGAHLKGLQKQMGAGSGDYMTNKLKEEGFNVIPVETYPQLIQMLAYDRIDAAVGFRTLGDEAISADPSKYTNIIKHELPFRQVDGYLIFSKKIYNQKQELIDSIWEALEQLWSDGTMDDLYQKYQDVSQ